MVGSDQGWAVAPYKETPADLMSKSLLPLTEVSTSSGPLHIVPGLLTNGTKKPHVKGLPDVMRGEETQILGALPDIPGDDLSVIILPGTHTKWVRLRGSTVTNFGTSMTGEIYALLLQHSILGRLVENPAAPDENAFQQGLDVVFRDGTGPAGGGTDILSTLFSARTLAMTGQIRPSSIPDYISGLMIGTEVAGFAGHWLNSRKDRPTVTICANDALASRYATALLQVDIKATLAVENAAARGLWRIGVRAGLIEREST
ncbi:2-dehydro-3-deoxygalactonokinase [Pseudarthrobacter siccitolerans]|uniref:2-dehydro-3-deoxygalactonokinase n=2 Tax=Pseudarthrobacter siccitolerans TaxID=861266 RepID=A0A024GXH3_9MICC|nr:2-dehydro-3-deoxygalactonokinase [Pseudarthrobacter siccitolerans]